MDTHPFECLVNASLLATDAADALARIEGKQWLNYYEETTDTQYGTIIYLFPEQRATFVRSAQVIGAAIPILYADGETFEQTTVRRYAVCLLLQIDSPSHLQATDHVARREWLNPNGGLEVAATSSVVSAGSYGDLIPEALPI